MADFDINAVTRKVSYTGSAGVGPYAFSFEILDSSDLIVYKNSSLIVEIVDYAVTINANGTGSITLNTAATASDTIVILGSRPIQRTTDFVTAGDLRASSLNEQLDSLTIFDQQISERVDRAIRAPAFDPTGINMTLPGKAERANAFLTFDSNGDINTSEASIFTPTAIFSSRATGTGSKTVFALPVSLTTNPSALQTYIDGVHQESNTYSVSGSNVTFTEAPPLNSTIEFVIFSVDDLGATSGTQVSISDVGGHYSSSSAESVLQEIGATGIVSAVGPATGTGAPVLATSPTVDAMTATTSITMDDAANVVLDTTTGTKIGTATSQKLGFFNATPVVQQNGTGETTGFTAGSGTGVNDDSTFTGNVGSTAYRINDIVKALKNLGILAE